MPVHVHCLPCTLRDEDHSTCLHPCHSVCNAAKAKRHHVKAIVHLHLLTSLGNHSREHFLMFLLALCQGFF